MIWTTRCTGDGEAWGVGLLVYEEDWLWGDGIAREPTVLFLFHHPHNTFHIHGSGLGYMLGKEDFNDA